VTAGLDRRSFVQRNPLALAFCASLQDSASAQEAASRARLQGATVAPSTEGFVVMFPRERPCAVKVGNGRIESAAVVHVD